MKRSQIFICALMLLVLSACKTQEDIRREQAVENLNEEIQQTKKVTSNSNSRFSSIEEQVAKLNGQLEELGHGKSQSSKEVQQLNERLNALEEANKKQVEFLKALTDKVNNQSGYIEEVIASLAKMSEKQAEDDRPSKKKTVNPDSVDVGDSDAELPATIDNGMKQYKAKDFDDAKRIFESVSTNKKASKKNREIAVHHLGMIEFRKKNYEGAQVYFSKLFSENPDSNLAPATLLHLGKSFKQLKSKEEANMTFDELISRFPKSKEAAEAAKLKK